MHARPVSNSFQRASWNSEDKLVEEGDEAHPKD